MENGIRLITYYFITSNNPCALGQLARRASFLTNAKQWQRQNRIFSAVPSSRRF